MRVNKSGVLGAFFLATLTASTASYAEDFGDWPRFGQNIANTASSLLQLGISKQSATKLTLKWVAPTGGDVSARAAVVDGVVYFPDWGGNLWALSADTGAVVWHHQLSDYG